MQKLFLPGIRVLLAEWSGLVCGTEKADCCNWASRSRQGEDDMISKWCHMDGAGILVNRCSIKVTDIGTPMFINLSNNSIQLLAGYTIGQLHRVTTCPNEDRAISSKAWGIVQAWPGGEPVAADVATTETADEVGRHGTISAGAVPRRSSPEVGSYPKKNDTCLSLHIN